MPIAQAKDGEDDEANREDGSEPETLVCVFANIDAINDDPENPIGGVFARLPPTGDEAVAGEGGVKVGQGCAEMHHERAEQPCANSSDDEADEPAARTKRDDDDGTLELKSAPPIPPAVERKGYEEDLQERIGQEPRLVEDDEIEDVGGEDDGPADEQTFGSEPDADACGEETGELNPVGDEPDAD